MPGNALGVVGRSKDLEQLYPCLYRIIKIVDDGQKQNQLVGMQQDDCIISPPTVLQLYPLALRSAFEGGKAQGRKFKSRKRGHDNTRRMMTCSTEHKNDSDSVDACHNHNDNHHDCHHHHGQLEEPFPTIYWLTHPFLKTLVSQLEIGSTDNVIQMQRRLASSEDYRSCMKLAHECYAKQRWDLLTEQDRDRITKQSKDESSSSNKWIAEAIGSKRGVAGIRNFDTVKCLHTHAAHYLAYLGNNNVVRMKENLVGKWVLHTLEEVARDLKVEGGKLST
jgi:hypothetical protein